MKKTLLYAAVLAACVGAQPAFAGVDATISYDSKHLDSAKYLVDSTITRSSGTQVYLNEDDMPSPPQGQRTSSFLQVSGRATNAGNLDAAASLATGGLATSTVSWSDQFVNDTGTAQQYSLALVLSNMQAKVGGYTADLSTRDFRAGFSADVSVNGVSVWHAARSLFQDGAGVRLESSGAALGAEVFNPNNFPNGYSELRVGRYTGQVGLGTFASGAALDVRYTLSSFSYWDDPDGCSYECGRAFSSVSDPFSLGAQRVVGIAAVPEPETYAMMLLGLGIVGWAGRRRVMLDK